MSCTGSGSMNTKAVAKMSPRNSWKSYQEKKMSQIVGSGTTSIFTFSSSLHLRNVSWSTKFLSSTGNRLIWCVRVFKCLIVRSTVPKCSKYNFSLILLLKKARLQRYLTGHLSPDSVLFLRVEVEPSSGQVDLHSTLFVQDSNAREEKWEGPRLRPG